METFFSFVGLLIFLILIFSIFVDACNAPSDDFRSAEMADKARKPKDATDPPDGRSGLTILVDHETGIEYLSTPKGGLTPRMKYEFGQFVISRNPVDET